ncbi:MAG: dihydrodipicolinate synthase family protein [Actinomycetia bacterium]|nr:dihydrodipicolinate synthase family protein [Actinomycetes bacterium]
MISGVYVPLLTAFASGGGADPARSAEHARWLAETGVDGLVPFGTSGEGPSLSLREKRAVLSALVAAVPGTPLVPAITESSLDTALQLVEAVNDTPATAVMLLPPFYFGPLGEDGLRRYVEEILAASTHPVLLYHIPEFGPPVPVPVVAGLPVWGVKDSGGDLRYTRAVLDAGKQVMVGAEHTIVDAVQAGAAGSIPGLANVMPEHLVAGVSAARGGDRAAAEKVLGQALKFRDEMLADLRPLEWMSAMKLLAESRHGVSLGGVRAPLPAGPGDIVRRFGPRLADLLAELESGSLLA